MKIVERIRYKGKVPLMHISKNLFNEVNYYIRQTFFEGDVDYQISSLDMRFKNSENYKALPAQTAQQILRLIEKDWECFFKSMKEYKKHPDKFLGKPKIPHYKPKDGKHLLILTNQQVKLKEGKLSFPKKLHMPLIKTTVKQFNQIRILPKNGECIIEVVSEADEQPITENGILAIDPGVRNIITAIDTNGNSFCIKGGVVKSINQYFNKYRVNPTKRYWKLDDAFHKISAYIIKYCMDNKIGTIVIGHNDGWKQNANLGKITNQNFEFIPHNKLFQKISYKAKLVGIKVIISNESHTSKCSWLDNEPIEHHDTYQGKRISRGQFISSSGNLINADVNGALNIMEKAIPKSTVGLRDRGLGFSPKVVSAYKYMGYHFGGSC